MSILGEYTTYPTGHSFDPPGQTQPVHLCLPYQIYLGMVRRWQALGGSWLLLLYGFQAFGFLMSKQGRYYTSDFWPPQRQKTTRFKQIQTPAIPLYVAVKGATSGWGPRQFVFQLWISLKSHQPLNVWTARNDQNGPTGTVFPESFLWTTTAWGQQCQDPWRL